MKGIICDTNPAVRDEAPQAYKDLGQVGTGTTPQKPLSLDKPLSFWQVLKNQADLVEAWLHSLATSRPRQPVRWSIGCFRWSMSRDSRRRASCLIFLEGRIRLPAKRMHGIVKVACAEIGSTKKECLADFELAYLAGPRGSFSTGGRKRGKRKQRKTSRRT